MRMTPPQEHPTMIPIVAEERPPLGGCRINKRDAMSAEECARLF
jgi:hypothetical protein